jgi:hypothetical protein
MPRHPWVRWALALAVAVCSVAHVAAALADVVEDKRRHYSFTLPEGFSAVPTTGTQTHAFKKEGFTRAELGQTITIEPLGRTLEHEGRSPEATVTTLLWKVFELSVVRSEPVVDGRPAVLYQVQVPLKTEAIRIDVLGERREENEAHELLVSIVGGLQGESSWLTEAERSDQLMKTVGKAIIVAFFVIGGLFVFRKLRS